MTDTPRSASSTSPAAGPNTNARPDTAGTELKTSLLEGAHDLGDQAKALAGDAAVQVRNAAESRISTGKNRAAEGLGSVASALRQTGDQLRSQDNQNTAITNYVIQAADRVESASSYLQDHSLQDTLGDIEQFARREPALFLGGAFLAGLLGGRFLKSSRAQPSGSNGGSNAGLSSASGASENGNRGPGRSGSGGRSQGDTGARRSEKKDTRGPSRQEGLGTSGGAEGAHTPKVPGAM